MLTRCPSCTTTFRVTPEQLKVRLGRVRCGQCQAVFNALDSLVEEAPQTAVPPPAPIETKPEAPPADTRPSVVEMQVQEILAPRRHGEATESHVPSENPETTAPAAFLDVEVVNLDEMLPADAGENTPGEADATQPTSPSPKSPDDAVADELLDGLMAELEHLPPAPAVLETPPATLLDIDFSADIEAANDPVHLDAPVNEGEAPPAVAEWQADTHAPESEPLAETAAASDSSEQPGSPPAANPEDSVPVEADYLSAEPNPLLHDSAHQGRSWPWALGTGMALGLLLIQLMLHYRVELAVLAPQLKPVLEAACRPLGCTVPLPHKIDLLSIESSDLHPGTQKGRLNLVATLKNRAPFAQELPRLEITLTDVADRTLIVKALQPAEYLPKDINVDKGFPAKKEINVDLTLDVGDTPAAGYRLYLYHP
ncbi:MAG: DUF3426 domain-containing protein [Rhodocyclaceae bacterium]|nr:MAG: DUF3426 domain-containing protein [Rhodocyclaceae bacterium]